MRNFWIGLALIATPVAAQPADPSEAANGDFGAKLLITDDAEGFWKAWEGPTPPQINTTSKITVSRPVHAMIVFHGCKPAADGTCNVTARFEILSPDGSSYDKPASGLAWNGPPAPGNNLLASLGALMFRLEPQDKLGRYQINAQLTDHLAGKKVELTDLVTAEAESPPPATAPTT